MKLEVRRRCHAYSAAVFPGRNAGASLKHAGRGFLMERHGLVFPGRNAGASLKRVEVGVGRRAITVVFPGRNAGASLKLARVLRCFFR